MEKFIEIPFGAKDSELGGWEYTIPEGYIASIENDKIIVKKEESEDERIRKWIINEIKIKHHNLDEANVDFVDKAIAWLEKQGEHNLIEIYPIFRVGDYIRNKKTGDKVLIEQLDIATKAYYYVSYDGAAVNHSDFSFLQQNEWEIIGQNITEQKPTDEEMKILLQTEYEKGRADAIEQMSVWSEEDENTIKFLISHFCTCHPTRTFQFTINKVITHDELLRKIRHLKHQSTWKPSDEQIQALEYQVHSTYEGSWQYKASKELLEQLKKL